MELNEKFGRITTFVFDVDGVMTDGSILVLENGLMARRMNVKDGYALQLAVKKGYRILVVSGAVAPPVAERLAKLGVSEVHMGITDKKQLVADYLLQHKLPRVEMLFMGDDMPDLPVLPLAGIVACPADAVSEIKIVADYISILKGGMGCVRDVIEKVMKLRGDWHHAEDIASK